MGTPAPLPALPADEQAAFDRLWQAHRKHLLARLGRRVSPRLAPRETADDLLARVHLRALRRWPRFRARPGRSGERWLDRLALDVAIEAWRHETRGRRDCRRDTPLPDGSLAAIAALVATGTSPTQAAARAELGLRVRQVLARLRPADRGVLLMRFEEQWPFARIAAEVGTTENAATVRYLRALARLKTCWVDLFGEGDPR